MTAINYQTFDTPQQLNTSKFLANGRCGFVLKPACLRLPATGAGVPAALKLPASLHVLRLEVAGALHVPTPGESRGDIDAWTAAYGFHWSQRQVSSATRPSDEVVSPFVKVEVVGGLFAGAAASRAECQQGQVWCSSAAARNGLNPDWDFEPVEAVASHPELAQLVVSVCYRNRQSKVRTLASTALPLTCARQGLRCLQLQDENGTNVIGCRLVLRSTSCSCPTHEVPAAAQSGIAVAGSGPQQLGGWRNARAVIGGFLIDAPGGQLPEAEEGSGAAALSRPSRRVPKMYKLVADVAQRMSTRRRSTISRPIEVPELEFALPTPPRASASAAPGAAELCAGVGQHVAIPGLALKSSALKLPAVANV